jgi:hypothetical protein
MSMRTREKLTEQTDARDEEEGDEEESHRPEGGQGGVGRGVRPSLGLGSEQVFFRLSPSFLICSHLTCSAAFDLLAPNCSVISICRFRLSPSLST